MSSLLTRFRPAQLVLRESKTAWFAPAVRRFVRALLYLAVQADASAPDRFQSEYTDKRQKAVSSRLFNMIGVCADEDAAKYDRCCRARLLLKHNSPRQNKRCLILLFVNTLYGVFFAACGLLNRL